MTKASSSKVVTKEFATIGIAYVRLRNLFFYSEKNLRNGLKNLQN